MRAGWSVAGLFLLVAGTALAAGDDSARSGLLFSFSADKGLTAEYAKGDPEPNFADKVKVLSGGIAGNYVQAADDQILAWHAAGNVYAQRGTLAFYWRPREPLGRNQFTIFRVGYADHTSWDMTWLRIDYNGRGFDAFVTNNNLARTRVSFAMPQLPKADEWVHLAVSWDETKGIRLYVNGMLAAEKDTIAVYDSGLDQFGPHSRTISPMQVQSAYSYLRGGDIDEIRVYDHMLSPESVASLAKGDTVASDAAPVRELSLPVWRDEWWLRYGWNRPGDPPPYLASPATTIRKVEFSDAVDIRQHMTGANDGIAETTWPGVYNRSRLEGRDDYFELPDWNVYVEGGKAVTFSLPDEPWNALQVQGAAHGTFTYMAPNGRSSLLATRPAGQERTYDSFAVLRGGKLRFDNDVQETPLQEVWAYDIVPGSEPQGAQKLSYTIRANADPSEYPSLDELKDFVHGRFVPDERAIVVALPEGAPLTPRTDTTVQTLPIVHVLIPADFRLARAGGAEGHFSYGWRNMDAGLDGIAIDLPPLAVKPTHGGLFPLNIQIKDPIWPARDLMDVSVSVKPGKARTLWLDTRDRILPADRSLYLTIAGAGGDFGATSLDGTRIRLVFKPRAEALKEHIADRVSQLKDNYAFFVEEHTNTRKLARFERFVREVDDVLRVDPDNVVARSYWAEVNPEAGWPAVMLPTPPKGVPAWAFYQVEDLKQVRKFVDWWIDNRQVPYGDLGGGISDDVDLLEQWPGLALMGDEPEKIHLSVDRLADAVDKNHMITNGLGTIKTDQLHSYEEGINVRSEDMYVAGGDPKVVERLMQTARAYPRLTETNAQGLTHIVTSYFSGTDVVREGNWGWSKPYSYLILHPGILLVDYNGNPAVKKLVLALADSYLAHGKQDASGKWAFPGEINSGTDQSRGELRAETNGVVAPLQLFWAAWRWTGDTKYLRPLESIIAPGDHDALRRLNANVIDELGKRETWGRDMQADAAAGKGDERNEDGATFLNFDRFIAWQNTGDKSWLEALYKDEVTTALQRMDMVTKDAWWIDRVEIFSDLLQRSRLGGMALRRNQIFPGNLVSWHFGAPRDAESVAVLLRDATPKSFRVVAYNLSNKPVAATITGAEILPGQWRLAQGIDTNGDDRVDGATQSREQFFAQHVPVSVTLASHKTSVIEFSLLAPAPPPSARADVGVGPEDIHQTADGIDVTVHSLGAADAPAGTLTLENAKGRAIASAATPPLPAPLDLEPKTAVVHLDVPRGAKPSRIRVSLNGTPEITLENNSVPFPEH
jgi:hypothetical protein